VTAIEKLRQRLAEIDDLAALERLASWDQQVMMPALGARGRAEQLGTLARLRHERATGTEIGEWLAELDQAELGQAELGQAELVQAGLDPIGRDLVRLARRDWERARRVPADLAAELSQAQADGQESWRTAREADDFGAFAGALERNVRLAREYGECLSPPGEGVYQALLYDYDFGLDVAELRRVFSSLSASLTALLGELGEAPPPAQPTIPIDVQKRAVGRMLRRIGVDRDSWRVDVSAHPFTSWMGRNDTRLTTRYDDGGIESLLSSLHEYGHGLYERQIDPALERTNLGCGTSMSMHESQSKLWENHVARHPAFAAAMAADLAAGGFEIAAGELHTALVAVSPSLIRVSADPLTYPLHIVLRFELELALVEGDLAVADLPGAWRDGVERLLGLQVPSDALGCLQDIHWGAGSFGYFPSYAVGCLIAAQLWEAMERELGSRDADLARGEVGPIRDWLGERVHRHGRRLDTIPLLREATGQELQVEPFLRYVTPFAVRA
jgi:carboxypeptidase Taq